MIGELLYHLHRHFRVVFIVGALSGLGVAGAFGYMIARRFVSL